MPLIVKQISSLEKVRFDDPPEYAEITEKRALQGDRICYQISFIAERFQLARFSVRSELADYVTLYQVRDVPMDRPITMKDVPLDGYITHTPGLMPDMLFPLAEQKNETLVQHQPTTVWVRVDVPKDFAPGKYEINIDVQLYEYEFMFHYKDITKTMTVEIAPAELPEQKLIYTRWFYADCIAQAHNVPIYSEEHWALIENYIAAAADQGLNMILVPTHTPPLNTAIGGSRPCVQLVDIEKKGDTYVFDCAKLRRFIAICKRNGIAYYEMAHLFSQWGAEFAPNIRVTENGKTDYMFGWHVKANSDEYRDFLNQYLPALMQVIRQEGIEENTYFHLSDEPSDKNLERYQTAHDLVKPHIGKCKLMDALSKYDFYERGLVECPVTNIEQIGKFLPHNLENQWMYYCVEPQAVYTNSFIAMKSCRTRILGYLLYKYDIKGFLHWGLNYYNSINSMYAINPYITTSADRRYPSGDAFTLYPSKDGAYHSLRGLITYDALSDMRVCQALEQRIGRDKVVEMIDAAAGGELTFESYPDGNEFPEQLRDAMIERIASLS